VVIDSIQTVYASELMSAPGSVGQVRETSSRLILFSKKNNIPVYSARTHIFLDSGSADVHASLLVLIA
ncbi:MAG TPA: hypothetical protein PKI91_14255, partial [Smithella sp.]|nr:hypothetical protein [Smithella sp.]HOZ62313.1 hypothetical protein [Smithellaceae bacterium]HQM44153.1 hypothetical protein [Smithellaceae bacterium]